MKIPEAAAGEPYKAAAEPYKALAIGGEQVSKIADAYNAAIVKAKQATEVSNAVSQASIGINDLHNKILQSPEFNTDPEASRDIYKQGMDAYRQKLGEGISDGVARQVFNDHFNTMYANHYNTFSNQVRGKQIDILNTTHHQDLTNFTNAAINSTDPKDFDASIEGIKKSAKTAEETGVWKASEAQQMTEAAIKQASVGFVHRVGFIDPVLANDMIATGVGPGKYLNETDKNTSAFWLRGQIERHSAKTDRDQEELKYNGALQSANRDYNLNDPNGDFEGAKANFLNPDNASKYGFVDKAGQPDFPMMQKAASGVEAKQRFVLNAQAAQNKTWLDKTQLGWLDKLNNKQLDPDEIRTTQFPPGVESAPIIMHWQGLAERQHVKDEKSDPDVFNYYTKAIFDTDESRRLKDPQVIVDQIGKGLSGKDGRELISWFEQASNPKNSTYINMAMQHFKETFKNDPDYSNLSADYKRMLLQYVKEDNLKGDDIYKKALDLTKPKEQSELYDWLNKSWNIPGRIWSHFMEPEVYYVPAFAAEMKAKAGVTGTNTFGVSDADMVKKIDTLKQQGSSESDIADELIKRGIDPEAYGLTAP